MVCDGFTSGITFHQVHSYLPRKRVSLSIGRYHIILLGDRGTHV